MQLRIKEYHGVSRWRWELQDDAGNFFADHEVKLDADAQEYKGCDDPPEYIRTYRAAHGGSRTSDVELLCRHCPDPVFVAARIRPPAHRHVQLLR